MSKKYYQEVLFTSVIIIVLLSLSAISAQEIETQNNNEIEIDNSITNEVNYEKNIETNYEEKTIKKSEYFNSDNDYKSIDKISNETTYETINDFEDCSSSIVQKTENETVISFRHDSSADIIYTSLMILL